MKFFSLAASCLLASAKQMDKTSLAQIKQVVPVKLAQDGSDPLAPIDQGWTEDDSMEGEQFLFDELDMFDLSNLEGLDLSELEEYIMMGLDIIEYELENAGLMGPMEGDMMMAQIKSKSKTAAKNKSNSKSKAHSKSKASKLAQIKSKK